MNNHTA